MTGTQSHSKLGWERSDLHRVVQSVKKKSQQKLSVEENYDKATLRKVLESHGTKSDESHTKLYSVHFCETFKLRPRQLNVHQ